MREELDELVKKYNLIDRTVKSFWLTYDNYLTDELTREERQKAGLTDRDSVSIQLEGYSYHVTQTVDFDYISVMVYCFRKGETIPLIEYYCTYYLNGEFFDDFWSFA